MANLSFSGKITKIGVPATGTGKNGEWTNTAIEVVEVEGEYPNSMVFSAFNKQEIIDTLIEGSLVDVLYNAKTTEYNGKTYNGLNLWKVEITEAASAPAGQATTKKVVAKAPITAPEDDLPF